MGLLFLPSLHPTPLNLIHETSLFESELTQGERVGQSYLPLAHISVIESLSAS